MVVVNQRVFKICLMIFVVQFSGEGRVIVPGCAWDFGCL